MTNGTVSSVPGKDTLAPTSYRHELTISASPATVYRAPRAEVVIIPPV